MPIDFHFIRLPVTLLLCVAIPALAAAQEEQAPAATDERAPPAAEDQAPAGGSQPKTIKIDLTQVLAQARAAAKAGKLREAVLLYQLILRFLPESRVARVELSIVLATLGERERATRLLRDIDREGLPPEVISTIDRILGPKRLTFFVIPELIYDNNINGQTKKDVIVIRGVPLRLSEDAKGREAYGYGLTLGAAYRLRDAAPRTTLTLGTRVQDVNARQDDTIDLFGSMSFAFQAGQRGVVTPSLSGAYRTRADQRYEWERAGGMSIGFPLGPVNTTLSGRYRAVEGLGDFKDRRDRRRSEINTSLSYGFPGLGTRFDGGIFREDWLEDERLDNDGFRAGLDFTLTKTPLVTPTIGGSFTRTDYENPFLANLIRHDRDYEGHVDLLLHEPKLFGNGGIVLGYRYRHETSDIPLFEYNEHEFTLGFRPITF